jgi:hypothetical protein
MVYQPRSSEMDPPCCDCSHSGWAPLRVIAAYVALRLCACLRVAVVLVFVVAAGLMMMFFALSASRAVTWASTARR